MPRKPAVTPTEHLHLKLEASSRARLDLHLFSDLEGRVPKGSHKAWVEDRIREYFDWKTLDLAPFGFPQGFFVRGPADMIEYLQTHFEEKGQ